MTEPTDSKPVAWLVPKLHTSERVRFTRAPGCTMTDAELTDYMEGRVMWLPTTFCDSDAGVTDKFGVVHKPKPLYTTPQPTQAQAGAVPLNHRNIEPVRRFLADRGIYLSNETTKTLIVAAHGIKGGQHG